MLSVVREIEGAQCVLNIQVPAYILSVYITFHFIKYNLTFGLHTHTCARACTCTSTAVINSQDVRYHWQKKKKNIESCMHQKSDFCTETTNQTVLIDHHWHVLVKLNVGSYKLHLQAFQYNSHSFPFPQWIKLLSLYTFHLLFLQTLDVEVLCPNSVHGCHCIVPSYYS